MNQSKYVFGIDLGTTYSAIAYVDDFGMPRVLMNQENTAVTPSVVYFNSATDVLVGQPAKESGRIDPQNYVEMIKRAMGGDHGRFIHDEEFRPEQISALILRKLIKDTEILLGDEVKAAVITVPAYFNEAQRLATEQAGVIAGLDVRGIIPEPVAAAVAYAANEREDQTLLVFDLGGGTFDVTVMNIEGHKVRVVCVGGDHDLGGRNWDEKVVAHLAEEWKSQTGSFDEPLADMETQQELFKQAEETKRLLTHRPESPLKVSHAGQSVRLKLTREAFDAMTADLLERTIVLTRQTMQEAAKQGVTKIDRLLLVGGSSYMPQVQDRLRAEFPGVDQELFEPEQAVAKGAAVYAASKEVMAACDGVAERLFGKDRKYEDLSETEKEAVEKQVDAPVNIAGSGRPFVVVNACSRNYGVEAYDDSDRLFVDYLILRNSAVPASKEETYGTYQANQSEILIKVYETDGADPPDDPNHPACKNIKQVSLSLPPALPVRHPIRVKFSLSEDGGRLRVEASDPMSGNAIDESVETFGALMPAQVEEMRKDLVKMKLG